jgi:predicted ferric reductase
MRVSPATLVALGAVAALVMLGVTDQVLPAADPRTTELRPWIAARALGITAYLVLGFQVALGLILSHPRNTAEWRKTRQVFPWHEMTTVFTMAFLALHVALLAVDPFAKVGVIGALVPGYSEYRPVAVGIGSVALYAMLFTAVTAKWTRLLPAGWWLKVHRLSAVAFLLAWVHAILAGTDGSALLPLYLVTGLPILAGVAHRWWTARSRPAAPVPSLAPDPAPSRLSLGRPQPASATLEEAR